MRPRGQRVHHGAAMKGTRVRGMRSAPHGRRDPRPLQKGEGAAPIWRASRPPSHGIMALVWGRRPLWRRRRWSKTAAVHARQGRGDQPPQCRPGVPPYRHNAAAGWKALACGRESDRAGCGRVWDGIALEEVESAVCKRAAKRVISTWTPNGRREEGRRAIGHAPHGAPILNSIKNKGWLLRGCAWIVWVGIASVGCCRCVVL